MLSLSAFAQRPDTKTGEVYFGYSHVTGDIGKHGWNATGAFNFSRWVAAEADFGGYYGSETILGIDANEDIHTYMFGPKISFELEDTRFTPWGHFLIGGSHVSGSALGVDLSDNSLAWALGGGADWHFNEAWAARGKIDLLHTSFFDNGETHARYGFGIVYNFR